MDYSKTRTKTLEKIIEGNKAAIAMSNVTCNYTAKLLVEENKKIAKILSNRKKK